MSDYPAFTKIPRWNRNIVVTEKIDGTNGLIYIAENDDAQLPPGTPIDPMVRVGNLCLWAGSRTRWITPKEDNYGFAKWVHENREELSRLGPGAHYGEWYGQGIQRRYGLDEKRFMLFNRHRWADDTVRPKCCEVSTVLYEGHLNGYDHTRTLSSLEHQGSRHVPGFMNPEGVIIYHEASRQLFKATVFKDEEWKGKAG